MEFYVWVFWWFVVVGCLDVALSGWMLLALGSVSFADCVHGFDVLSLFAGGYF